MKCHQVELVFYSHERNGWQVWRNCKQSWMSVCGSNGWFFVLFHGTKHIILMFAYRPSNGNSVTLPPRVSTLFLCHLLFFSIGFVCFIHHPFRVKTKVERVVSFATRWIAISESRLDPNRKTLPSPSSFYITVYSTTANWKLFFVFVLFLLRFSWSLWIGTL